MIPRAPQPNPQSSLTLKTQTYRRCTSLARTDGRTDGQSPDNQNFSDLKVTIFSYSSCSGVSALHVRELDIGNYRMRALDNVSIFMLELAHTADNFSLYLHRLKLQPPNLGSCLVHQKLQVSFLFLVHPKLCFCFPYLRTVLLLKLFPVLN